MKRLRKCDSNIRKHALLIKSIGFAESAAWTVKDAPSAFLPFLVDVPSTHSWGLARERSFPNDYLVT